MVEVIERIVRSTRDLPAESLAELCAQAGWVPIGATVEPFPRRLGHGNLLAAIFSEGAEDFMEFIFEMIPPDLGRAEFVDAVNGDYSPQIDRFHRIRDEVLELLSVEIAFDELSEVREDSVDFVESGCWRIVRGYLSIGVAHADEDSPVLLLARLRQS
ncbi:hypothetical protein KQY30_15190 [Streptomyces sp. GMY02]|uniref:hypothetical protein n=1 Tax=Streptomyces sp. GMY02 TaxID=1333528 RepID=UPI001C2C13C8|nr:hypothetical protein [Streptomyces sp. GMY02]QXE35411.1 hypothetical protein KQY30_15190 [Streptomyces sp. GMY02]